jgi:CBS domain containing-hemolysin-like protein
MESTFLIDALRLIAVVLLVLANGFFVAAEFSLVSVRRTRVAELVAQGDKAAKWVHKAIQNTDQVIAATQLGITLASLGLGWIGEPALAHLLEPVVNLFPTTVRSGISHSLSAGIAFAIITFLHVVIGELAPKSIALQDPERTSLAVARPTLFTEWIFTPAIWLLNGTGNFILKLVGIEPAAGHELVHSVEEIKMLVSASAESGVFEADESEMLHAIFEFNELLVRQVMIPRTEVLAIEADLSLEESIRLATRSTYTKFPVYEDDMDHILGVVHIKDLLRARLDTTRQDCKARQLVREALFVPETISVQDLLKKFRASRQHIAIVMDEYGGTAGLITLEDILEEIVGEVSDPFDAVQPEIQIFQDGTALIDGLALIEEVNQAFGIDLEDPHYDTIAGYILGKLGRIARVDDVVEAGSVRLQIKSLDGLRIAQIALTHLNVSKPEIGTEEL